MADVDLSALDVLHAKLLELDGVGAKIAAEARPELEAIAKETASAGTDPYGAPWPATKAGERALPDAAGAISSVVSGVGQAVITLIARFPYGIHQGAKGKTLPRRVVLPTLEGGVPKRMREVLARAAARVVGAEIGGRS